LNLIVLSYFAKFEKNLKSRKVTLDYRSNPYNESWPLFLWIYTVKLKLQQQLFEESKKLIFQRFIRQKNELIEVKMFFFELLLNYFHRNKNIDIRVHRTIDIRRLSRFGKKYSLRSLFLKLSIHGRETISKLLSQWMAQR